MSLRPELLLIAKLVPLAMVVWATPPRYWRRVAEFGISPDAAKDDPLRSTFRRALGISDDAALSALCAARRISLREAKMQVIGLAGPWRHWRPPIRLKGEEHLVAALRRGKGIILWASAFAYSHLIFKMALQQAGYRATQLSRPAHGFGRTGVEIRLLNPIWRGVEERFLRDRIMIRNGQTEPAIKALRSRLAENGIVVITVGNEARHTVDVPFLGHRLRLAVGPVSIAQSSGAALVPGFAVRNAEGGFEVTFDEPLQVALAGEDRERLGEGAAELARRIEPFAEAFPEQWAGWNELLPGDELRSAEIPAGETARVRLASEQRKSVA